MGPDESDELGERLLVLRKEFGLTILVIEHHVPLVLRVCDHVYVLNFGRLLAEGKPSFIQTHPEVVAAYLGGEAPEALAATHETDEDAALDAQLEERVVHAGDDSPTVALKTPPRRKARTAAEQRAERAAAATRPAARRTRKKP
jgi:ABC-type methionine transport system ATPase subunit